MTRDQDIDRVLDRWLAEGPTQMPSRFLDDTLERIDRAPQPRLARLRTRLPAMNVPVRFAAIAAAIVIAVGVGIVVPRLPSVGTGIPTGGVTPVTDPGMLVAKWSSVGDRAFPKMPADGLAELTIDATTLSMNGWKGPIDSSWSLTGPDGQLVVTMRTPEANLTMQHFDCRPGQVGSYTVRLTSDRRTMTITPVAEACSPRADILAGDWTRWVCAKPDSVCAPMLEAGRHETSKFHPFSYGTTGRLAYTVPDGWTSEPNVNGGLFALRLPSVSDAARISLISNAYASDQVAPCNVNRGAVGVGRTPEDLTNWLRILPGLVVSAPTEVTIGGLRGIAVDLSMAPGWTPTCEAGLYTFSLSGSDGGDWSDRLRLTGTNLARYILLDRGDGSSLVIDIEAPVAAWDAFKGDVQPILDGLEFTR